MKILNSSTLAILFSTSSLADNKTVVQDFYNTAFVKHQPAEAMMKYVGAQYKQHNPLAQDGQAP